MAADAQTSGAPTIAPERVAEIAATLVRFDTAYGGPGSEAGDEAALQEWIGDLLRGLGFEVEIWEPDPADFADHPMYAEGLHWRGRPVLSARRKGAGGGRSLVFNGHIDTVRAEPLDQWTRDPWGAEVEGDRLYGRGSCDMKGGIAAALAAIEAVVSSGDLAGDLYVQTAPDEETTGMGAVTLLHRGLDADACLVPEPSGYKLYSAYRGILYGRVDVTGRPAHAEIPQPHHSAGGGVNAIDLARKVMDAFDALSDDWALRPDQQHPLLAPPRIFPTGISGGEFIASLPGSASIDFDLTYLPANADENGFGSKARAEVEEHLRRWAETDSWLREHPPRITWVQDYPAAEVEEGDAFGELIQQVGREKHGLELPLAGFQTWGEAATYLRHGIPAYCIGPGAIERAHMIDEWTSISELGQYANLFADVIRSWCGPAN